jgi:hypothetical protein
MFIGDTITPVASDVLTTQWAASGAQAAGSLVLVDCTITCNGKSSLMTSTSRSQMATTFQSVKYTGNTKRAVSLFEGGSVRVVDSPSMPKPVVSINGVALP